MAEAITLNVYLQNNDYVKQMELDLVNARIEAADWQLKYKQLSYKMADIQHQNLELIDICKVSGYRFRPALDITTWGK